jgi:hypothetical protein
VTTKKPAAYTSATRAPATREASATKEPILESLIFGYYLTGGRWRPAFQGLPRWTPSPGPPRLMRTPAAGHPLPQGGERTIYS